ncbi:DUF389 domain-containing protein [Pedobacter sp. SYP-B3415]|uniref:DUF389 domain-containing protein n=1 Tax=Pedobacter sp. SYP-B3415 TaxID=2496641 RepID=UPI00351377F9
MPPLCTAGFGLASGDMYFFLGAIYLSFINSVFICVATYLIVRYLKFRKKNFEDKADERKVTRYIWIIVFITAAPSIYLAYRIVDKSIFENNANSFIQNEMNYTDRQVINKSFNYNRQGNVIDLLILGNELSKNEISALKRRLTAYKLSGTKLIIRQGLNAKNQLDFTQIKASILEAVYQGDSSAKRSAAASRQITAIPDLKAEIRSLFPYITSYTLDHLITTRLDTSRSDTITTAIISSPGNISTQDALRMKAWLKTRTGADSLRLIITN